MRNNIVTIGNEQVELNQFCDKFQKSDIEPTRGELYSVLNLTKENNPSLVPDILNLVKTKYHFSLAF